MQKTNHELGWLKRQGRRSEKSLGLLSFLLEFSYGLERQELIANLLGR